MIEVALVEDDRVFRENLGELIDGEDGLSCTRRFGSVEEIRAAAFARPPDVILLDIQLPGMLGSQGVRELAARFPPTAILMLTVYDDEGRVFEAICNGARGYLLKKTVPARLVEQVRAAHEGGAPMSPEVARHVIRAFQPQAEPATALTPQEKKLLALLADGYSYQNAAGQLAISINTIRNHVRSVYDKLRVHTKSEAVAKALKLGLLR
ncbi:MAG: response regulator transcription factor [Kofleriaceae bacterium]